MVQSVELLLDAATDAAIRRVWSELIDAGLPSAGRHTGASNAPHITVAVARSLPAEAEGAIAAVGRDLPLPLPLRLGGLVLFGPARGEFVLARLVTPSATLLATQRTIAAELPRGADVALPATEPDQWTPHVTLARRLSAAQVALALPLAAGEITGASAVALRRWDGEAKREWIVAGQG